MQSLGTWIPQELNNEIYNNFFLVFSLFGCSPKSLENFVEKSLISTSGNKPPNNFKIVER